uniref:Col_cuticle_N domain-containing protein n=1 Tax=Steinernema glaseri TaxID=37863 RepID=A0A1I7YPC2_9BILA
MFRIVFLSTFAAALVSASNNTSTIVLADARTTTLTTTTEDCLSEVQAHLYVTLVGVTVLSIIFLISILLPLGVYIAKITHKMNEAETHLHQVMDAVMVHSIPRSVINEIGLIAEEAQKKKKS